jgi:hypothetical protein
VVRPLVVFLVGCGFHGPSTDAPKDGPPPVDVGDPVDGLRSDAMADAMADAKIVNMPDGQPSFTCGISPAPLVCFLFDNNVTDSTGHVTLTVTGMPSYDTGIDGQAIALDAGDELDIDSSLANKVSASSIAIRTYVKIPTLPSLGNRMGIVDNNAYRMFVQPGGTIRFAIGNSGALQDRTTIAGILPNVWTRVAGTWDGTTMQVYFNGIAEATTVVAGGTGGVTPVVTTSTQIAGNQGANVDQLVGYLDDFELFGTTAIMP